MYVMGWDLYAGRNRIARRCGLDAAVRIGADDERAAADAFTAGRGFDMAVMAFGGDGSDAMGKVKQVMKRSADGHQMGRVVLVGGLRTDCRWGAGMGNLDLLASARTGPGYHDEDWEHGRGSYPAAFVRWDTASNMALVLRLIAEGRLKVKPLTTQRFPLDRIDQAVDAHLNAPARTLGTVILMD